VSVSNLWDRKAPVTYTVAIQHHPETGVSAYVEGIADDPRSRASALWALAETAAHNMTAAQIHQAMLSRIDALMSATADPEVSELRRLANACQAYEESA
jgi:hypothetical protein